MFHEKTDVRLIRLVKENSVLYDINHAKYMDFNSREVAWQKIGDELKRPAADCKVRWINIRDVHRRILKKNVTHPVHPPRQYKYEAELAFMKHFYRDVVVLSMEDEDDDVQSKEWNEMLSEDPGTGQPPSEDSDVPVKKAKIKNKKKRPKRRSEPCFEEVNQPMPSFSEIQISEMDPGDPVDSFVLSIRATLKSFSPYHLNVAKTKIFAVVQEHDLQQIVETVEMPNGEQPTDKVTTSLNSSDMFEAQGE